jgi:hypothetical protein
VNRNVAILSPHFPPHYHRFWAGLKRAGAHALGIGDAPGDRLAPEVRESLTEYVQVSDMHDHDQLVRACGYFTHRYGKLDRFDSLNEYWLAAEARIRDDFNIYGIRSAEIETVRRKSRMKARFREAGLPVARGRIVDGLEAARRLIAETGYPVVAKPDAGVGALDTFCIRSEPELEAFFRDKPPVDYLMEEFVTGVIHSFDGLADGSGQPVFLTAHVFSQGIMETVNEARHLYYYSLREIPPALEAAGRRCLSAFAVRERFFHIEFFLTPAGEFVPLEVNLRPPGGFTTDMFNYGSDIDIYRAWAELVVHGATRLDYQRRFHCAYASRRFPRPYRHSHEEIVSRLGARLRQVESVPGVFASALGDIGYILRAERLEEVLEDVRFIHATAD